MKFIETKTKSGILLYVLPMPGAHSVASGVLVHVGTREEKLPEESGLAHGFEHLPFQGTKEFPNKKILSEYIEEIGGFQNAFTWKELTVFHNQVPTSAFERSIHVLHEQLYNSLFLEENIKKEMEVIIEELRRREDNPDINLTDLVYANLFKNHPLGNPPVGTEVSLKNLKQHNFLDFLERYYHPGNFSFIVVGNVNIDDCRKIIDKYFVEEIKRKKEVRKSLPLESVESKIVITKKIKQVYARYVARIIDANSREKEILNLYALILGNGSASPLFQEIRDKRGLCYSVGSYYIPGTDAGLFTIHMGIKRERYEEAIKCASEIVQEYAINETRLEHAKKAGIGSLALEFDVSPASILRKTAFDIISFGKPQNYEEVKRGIETVTTQDIEAVVKKFLKPENFTTVLLMPEDTK